MFWLGETGSDEFYKTFNIDNFNWERNSWRTNKKWMLNDVVDRIQNKHN